MKTLNRTLSLALVFALVFSLMSFAFAADTTTTATTTTATTTASTTAKAFTDASSITHTTAVNTMTSLNIIKGYTDGSYKPATNVTRAEMCKMICLVLNGGKDPVLSTSNTPKYTDIKGHWAQAYIEYCASQGIVAGMGDGTFHPDDTVTASQAAKMLLVAMSYDSTVFKFTGADWEVNVNVAANKSGLYDDITDINASANLNRDNAAQMIYNALGADTMKITWTTDPSTGKTTQTYELKGDSLLSSKFGMKSAIATLGNVSYDEVDKDYDTSFSEITYAKTADKDAAYLKNAVDSPIDYSTYFGMQVKVLYSVDSYSNATIYGVYPYKSSVVLSGVVGQIAQATFDTSSITTATNMTIGGKTYKFDKSTLAATPLYSFNVATESTLATFYTDITVNNKLYQAAYNFTALDTNGNGKIDKIVVYPFEVYKVSYVGTKEATLVAADNYSKLSAASVTKITLADDDVYTGIAAEDWVKMTPKANTVSGKNTYTKITAMSGAVTQTSTDSLGLNEGTISNINFVDIYGAINSAPTLVAGNTYKTVIQINTFVFYDEVGATAASAANYALCILAAQDKTYSTNVAKLMFSDGTISSVDTAADYSAAPFAANALVEFTKSASTGAYTLKAATATTGGYKAAIATPASYATVDDIGYITSGGVTYRIDDSAVFFVQVVGSSTTYKIMTGAQVKSLSAVTAVHNAFYTTNTSTGYKSIQVGHITIAATATSAATGYGYMTKAVGTAKEDGTTIYNVTYWDGAKEVTAKASSIADFTPATMKGKIFQYTTDSKGYLAIAPAAGLTLGCVVGYESPNISFSAATNGNKIGTSTKVFYINSKDVAGVAGGTIRPAKDTSTPNAYYVDTATANGSFKLVVYDVNNAMENTASQTITANDATTVAFVSSTNTVYTNTGTTTLAAVDTALTKTAMKTEYKDSTGVTKLASAVSAVNDTITYTFADGTSRTLTIKQGAVITPTAYTASGITDTTLTWTINGTAATAGTTYVVAPGATVIATATTGTTGFTVANGKTATLTATDATAVITTAYTATPADAAAGAAPSTTTVTFTPGTGATTFKSGVSTFTWASVAAGTAAPAVVAANPAA